MVDNDRDDEQSYSLSFLVHSTRRLRAATRQFLCNVLTKNYEFQPIDH